jgi:aryl-alcohol dehydrogenase-like predicted oxidoreductase
MRVGLGCMRMSTDDARDEDLAAETIAAAADAGVTVFDTAHAYGRGPDELGHNERLVARALRLCGAQAGARIVTKGGMTRTRGGWVPDGRAKAILSDCEASLLALDGLPIDLYLIHAPDPRTPWRTSVRALARLVDGGLVRRVGLANVNRRQLDEALEVAPVVAVQIALGPYNDSALRGGLLAHCLDLGIAVMAHSPFGGPRRANGVARDPALARVAGAHAASPHEVALAWLLELSPAVIAIPGARRPETARSAARAARLSLDDGDRAILASSFGATRAVRYQPVRTRDDTDVVLVMGIPGAGKSRTAEEYAARGYLRLNRDTRGGTLRELSEALDDALRDGVRRAVLDNTWLTRATRSHVIDAARRRDLAIRCIWLDTPLGQAQVNIVERMLERFGSLPNPDELRGLARREPGMLQPTSQMRALRELEAPSTDEGFSRVERVDFVRTPVAGQRRAGVVIAAGVLRRPGWEAAVPRGDRGAPHLIFDWRPDGTADAFESVVARLAAEVSGPVAIALCPHAAGPPSCWCRPPLPGLPLAFARAQGVDLSRSILIGTGPAHRALATAIGAQFVLA